MGVFRRLSHAFAANHVPNFSYSGQGEEDLESDRRGLSSNMQPPAGASSNDHAYASSSLPHAGYRDPLSDNYEPSFVSSRHSFESDDRKSIAPSYLTSTRGTVRNDESEDEEDDEGGDKYSLMTAHLYQRAQGQGWFKSKKIRGMGAVSIRMKRRQYRTFPRVNPRARDAEEMTESLLVWESAISTLNPEVAIKISSKVVQAIMARLPPHVTDIAIDANTRIQVIDEIAHLAGARKHQFAAFVRSESCLVIWADEVDTLMESAEALELRMIQYVWASKGHEEAIARQGGSAHSESGGLDNSSFLTGGATIAMTEKGAPSFEIRDEEELLGVGGWTDSVRQTRPVVLFAPLITGLAMILNAVFVGSGIRQLVIECMLDGRYYRLALIATTPFTLLLAQFFCICVIGNLWQAFGPIAHFHQNSSYYSGSAPARSLKTRLPHFTVQMPVYKEGLEAVIVPTIESLKKAITTYERQGGTVSILICEDGMQLWSEADAEVRKAFYERNAISWVARPKHGHEGFLRKGRFKKASNMNFACALSLRVEEIMDEIRPMPTEDEIADWIWTDDDEGEVYDEALQRALEETNGVAWASGNIRIGEYILIIDSDTRVPEDCFLDAASELDASPEIAIIQHESDVMMVIGHYFENGIAHFTRRINKAISFCCANGEVAPFVGHNAFLRWSAVQDACFVDPDDGLTKIWSESHVSEDFDMSLRLQMKGYSLRWATYSQGGFKEGVSLTCDDELNRWQKYGYGCSELVFRPLKAWWRGPITPLFSTFIFSNIPIHSKVSVVAYVSSYWAIAIAAFMSCANWILVGMFDNILDKFYLESWQVFLTCVVVFSFLSNICSAIFMYRLKEAGLGYSLVDNFKWLLFFFFFFSGLSWHLCMALGAHIVGYNMTWGSTIKEVNVSNFFKEVPAILRRFWGTYIWSWANIIGIIIMSTSLIPPGYRITAMTAILPSAVQAACHILYPIVLNPWLMMFSF